MQTGAVAAPQPTGGAPVIPVRWRLAGRAVSTEWTAAEWTPLSGRPHPPSGCGGGSITPGAIIGLDNQSSLAPRCAEVTCRGTGCESILVLRLPDRSLGVGDADTTVGDSYILLPTAARTTS